MERQTNEIGDLARRAADDLRRGDLTLAQVAGLSEQEMNAVAEAAEALRRGGDLDGAAAVWGMLLSYDPYVPRYWKALAELHRRRGRWVGAVGCYELLARVQDRTTEDTLAEAACLTELGETAAARRITADTEGRTQC